MSDAPQIKTEIKTEIKEEPGLSPPAGTPADEDLYEDAGDLEFYDKNQFRNAFENIYLARVPKYMWQEWTKMVERLGDDDEIQIGTIRTWAETDADGNQATKLRMLLDSQVPEHQLMPKEYDLDLQNHSMENHFIFSEEDLPGFKARNKARQQAIAAGMPASILRPKQERTNKPTYDRKSRWQPYYRKAIPKKTRIFGKVRYDMRVEPRDKDQESRLLAQQIFQMEDGKQKVEIIGKKGNMNVIRAGTGSGIAWQNDFIKNTPPVAKPKKTEANRAVRLAQNVALDLLFDCFKQYQYWSIKALRQTTKQPDAYLRQLLEGIAVLVKSGPFANHYTLSDAYKDDDSYKTAQAQAAAVDDDDEGEEMEDVIPS